MLKTQIRENLKIVTGQVLEAADHRYSSTSVSGGGRDGNVSVSSTTHHHQVQKIWYKNTETKEDKWLDFKDENISVREGHKIKLLAGKKTGSIHRFLNVSTGFYWRITGRKGPKSIFRKILSYLKAILLGGLAASFFCLPFINLLNILKLPFTFRSDDFKNVRRYQFLLCYGIVFVSALSLLPFIVDSAPTFGYSKTMEVDKTGILFKWVTSLQSKQSPPALEVVKNRVLYLKTIPWVLFVLLFPYYTLIVVTNDRIQLALDEIAGDEL